MYVIPKSILCPYCGATVQVEYDVSPDYDGRAEDLRIECNYSKCGASWYSDGTVRTARRD